ncbi:YerC/YecD family TrpR-related protein [Dokdonella sp.]|uniref:YerC/YecD family TrpR-related protein n=1 Tax=Dokdonella sp. TaxID=2291710 RepID=UPI0025BC6A87|nr:YerC/YecD family TrpR-related protein [Dokdonella sp.]MBX3690028.1 DNA-binding transcriptional regulator [Dokdonella sp.]
MKRRPLSPSLDSRRSERALCEALLNLRSVAEMQAFLDDLCTPAEREAMRERWSVVPQLLAGKPYRQIHEATAVSITTIGRVARCLEQGAGGYALAAARLKPARKPRSRAAS